MTEAFTLSCVARMLLGVLVRSGTTSLVVSPGSRSTPYLSAALEIAQLSKHLVVDERSAGYVALGLARARSRPVALLCTSGTAAANYLPAVVEARQSSTPLVIFTADRPLSLQGCAAPQTVDQTRLFGSHVLGAISVVMPRLTAEDFLQLRRQILSLLALCRSPIPGPVHINLHTPKPLEIREPRDAAERAFQRYVESLIAEIEVLKPAEPPKLNDLAVHRLTGLVDGERRGLITCGYEPERPHLDPKVLARFARNTGYPVVVDAAHPLRLDAPAELRPYLLAPFEPLLRLDDWWKDQLPKVVVQLGRPLTSSRFERYLNVLQGDSSVEKVLLLARHGWPDPSGRAEWLGSGNLDDALERASELLESSPPRSSGWAARWFRASRVTDDCVEAEMTRARGTGSSLGEFHAVSVLLNAQPKGSRLVIGNSLAIRNVDFLATSRWTGISVEALRGASGIDGVISTATGFALAGDRPTTLLLGDISFLHDVGGLWATLSIATPLAIVVLNNGGGRIFEQLPVADSVGPDALEYWTTPQRLDLGAAAKLYGLTYIRAVSESGLDEALRLALARPRATVIDVVVSPESARQGMVDFTKSLQTAMIRAGLLSEPNAP